MGSKALFICCGKKNQPINTNSKPPMVTAKYFFTQLFLLFIKKAIIACIGQAHIKLKLFFTIEWSVLVHIKTNKIPNAPVKKNNNPSKRLKKPIAFLLVDKLSKTMPINKNEKTIIGVKKDCLLVLAVYGYNWCSLITN